MFARKFFGGGFFGARYYGDGGDLAPPGASAAAIWAYVLPNGKSAGQNLAENNTMLLALTGAIEGTYTMFDLLRIIAAVAAGESRITPLGAGAAHVEFDAAGGTDIRVAAEMEESERISLTLTP